MLQVKKDFADTEQPDGQHDEIDAVEQFRHAEGETLLTRCRIDADEAQRNAEGDHADRLDRRSAGQEHGKQKPEDHQTEIVSRPEGKRNGGEWLCDHDDQNGRHRAGKKRPERRSGQRHPRPALPGHGITIDAGDDG
ncbi:hypothetical protein D3C72_747150 [compost metagenome]